MLGERHISFVWRGIINLMGSHCVCAHRQATVNMYRESRLTRVVASRHDTATVHSSLWFWRCRTVMIGRVDRKFGKSLFQKKNWKVKGLGAAMTIISAGENRKLAMARQNTRVGWPMRSPTARRMRIDPCHDRCKKGLTASTILVLVYSILRSI
jgi:hypothetical protein